MTGAPYLLKKLGNSTHIQVFASEIRERTFHGGRKAHQTSIIKWKFTFSRNDGWNCGGKQNTH